MYETNFHKAATAQEAAALLNSSDDGKISGGGANFDPHHEATTGRSHRCD